MMFILAVCSALLTAGAALECEVCLAINSNTCSGHYERCKSPQSHCMVTRTEKSFKDDNGGQRRSAVIEKSCGSLHSCSHPATLTTEKFHVRVTTVCCSNDFCNNGTINWQQPNSTDNGLSCPSCFARNSPTCDVETHVNCTGDENHCVQYSATHGEYTITVAGCASESMARSNGGAAFRGSSVTVYGMQNRNNGGGSVRHDASLLSLLAMLTILSGYSRI
ncbi:phospholipase A2 inhibitor and Ly6/PLAUR domain-containing protein-like [Dendropsophus ebraccatus]|uniref:phospholipase A2 inhibitor and Ly6/PLAUR domain-containing protein-like n=1 Tax=Dendropsophus ebraccatus TaxID=150705 RepID=UPI0038317A76